jgi:Fe-S cluster assembly protein SufD
MKDHYRSRHERFTGSLGDEPAWIARLRRDAIGVFGDLGFPSTRLEEWRYTNVRPIASVPFELPSGEAARVSREALEPLAVPIFACSLFVFVDGRFAPELSAPRALAGDVRVESLAELREASPERLEPFLARVVETKRHPFAALNTAFLDDGAVLIVPPGVQLERPMHVVFLSSGEPAAVCHPRVLVVAGANSRFSIVQDHVSLADAQGFTNAVTEIFMEPGAAGELVLLQRENPQQLHTSNLSVRLERDARLTTHTVTLGGALVRNDLEVTFAGEGADCTANGLFVGGDRQLIDNHTLIDHAVPLGTSRELYKGVLTGSAKGVFRGRVIVRPDAQHTNAVQSNPNLLLSDAAEIDTKPQLEIHADDVKCSHGSTIGRLDDDALFYLRARGIGELRAREMLSRGFASEVTHGISTEPLSQEIDRLVSEKLDS